MLSIKTFLISYNSLIKALISYHIQYNNQRNLIQVTLAIRIYIHQFFGSLGSRCIVKN